MDGDFPGAPIADEESFDAAGFSLEIREGVVAALGLTRPPGSIFDALGALDAFDHEGRRDGVAASAKANAGDGDEATDTKVAGEKKRCTEKPGGRGDRLLRFGEERELLALRCPARSAAPDLGRAGLLAVKRLEARSLFDEMAGLLAKLAELAFAEIGCELSQQHRQSFRRDRRVAREIQLDARGADNTVGHHREAHHGRKQTTLVGQRRARLALREPFDARMHRSEQLACLRDRHREMKGEFFGRGQRGRRAPGLSFSVSAPDDARVEAELDNELGGRLAAAEEPSRHSPEQASEHEKQGLGASYRLVPGE